MYTTLSINNSSIRILTVKGKKVHRWGSTELAEGLIRDGLIAQPEAVGEIISSLFKSTKAPREKAVVSISGLSFTYRFLSLPRVKPDLQEEAIRRSFKREISLPLDELYLSWQPLPGEGNEQTFFVLGVSRYLVDALVQTLEKAGVEPSLMDIHPLALARAANRGNAIIASLEPECYDIIIIANGTPTIIHTIIPRGEGATLEDNIKRLANELSKTIAFYQSYSPKNSVPAETPLLLTGKLAEDVTTQGLLQATTEYNIEPLVPTLGYPPDMPAASYAANIGLALKKLPQPKPGKEETASYSDIDINLLAEKYRKPKAPPLPVKSILLGVFLAIAIILLYPIYQSKLRLADDNSFLDERFQRISRELNLANLAAEQAASTENTIQELSVNLETIKTVHESILGTQGDFTANSGVVIDNAPPNVYLQSVDIDVDIDKEIITIKGEADSVFTVIDYVYILESPGVFSEINITKLDEDYPSPVDTEEGEVKEESAAFTTFIITIIK
jgi:hypothetical protein